MMKYKGTDGVIPSEFKGESITVAESADVTVKPSLSGATPRVKVKFDM